MSDAYTRLLRWYPRPWRDAHGAVFLDTLREQSEHDGRTRPSAGESFAAMTNGLGTRLDARLAGTLALTGIALRAGAELLVRTIFPAGLTIVDPVQNAMLTAALALFALPVLAGLIALARANSVLSPGRAVAVLTTGGLAVPFFCAGTWAWTYGLQLADTQVGLPDVAAAATPLLSGAVVIGTAAGWLVMDALLSRTHMGWLPRTVSALLGGAILAVLAGYAVMMELAWVTVGVAVVALSLRPLGAWPSDRPRVAPQSAGRLVRVLAGVSAVIGVLGIGYAITAPAWSPVAPDGTVAVEQAILGLLIGALPLVVAMGMRAEGPRPHVWGPLALVGIAMGAIFYGYTDGPSSGRIEVAVPIGSLALGLAIVWWVTARLAGTRRDRWLMGVSILLACTVWRPAALLPVAIFVLPVAAAILAVRGDLAWHPSRRRAAAPNQ